MIQARYLQRLSYRLRPVRLQTRYSSIWTCRFSSSLPGDIRVPTKSNQIVSSLLKPLACQSQPRILIDRRSLRYQSTAADVTPIADVQAGFASTPEAVPPDFSSDFIPTPLDDVTSSVDPPSYEHLGFLKEMGLDYGWGPTAFVETLLEHVHIYAGTPWWASIAITMVMIRAALIKIYMDASDAGARNSSITSYNAPLMERYKTAAVAKDVVAMREASTEMKELRKAAGIKYWKLFVPFVQIPIGFGTFRLMRGMASLPVPGFDTGGLLWIQDLTISDPTFILPAVTSACYYFTFKVGGESGNNSIMSPTVKKVFLYVLPPVSFLIQLFWPAGLQFTFFVSALISLIQSGTLRQLWFRNIFGLQPFPHQTSPDARPNTGAYSGNINKHVPPTTPGVSPEKGKGILGGTISDIRGAVSEVVKNGQKIMEKKKAAPGKRTPGELRYDKEYNARRNRERAQEKFEQQQEQESKAKERAERRRRQKQ